MVVLTSQVCVHSQGEGVSELYDSVFSWPSIIGKAKTKSKQSYQKKKKKKKKTNKCL